MPKIGSSVRVTVKSKNIYYYTYKEQPYIYCIYEGTVLPLEKWEKNNTFNMSGDSKIAVRNINIHNVVSIDLCNNDHAVNHFRVFNVASNNKNYTVLYDRRNGDVKCDCMGFSYRKKCKHSDAVLLRVENMRKDKE